MLLVVTASCPADQWQCNNTQCIPAAWRCDESFDCNDHSDEVNCPGRKSKDGRTSNECHPDEFQCRTGSQCIHKTWVCDIDHDCEDGSDEEECNYYLHLHNYVHSTISLKFTDATQVSHYMINNFCYVGATDY